MRDLIDEINRLKREKNAVILAHNYCRGEVQDIADYTGDSLELARVATKVEAATIVFCGVYFMAETAKILNPAKTVLIPDASAGCAMADMINGAQMVEFKAQHPGAAAVCYVNSTAAVKAECDLCVTSGNAERVMRSFPADREILFVPDQHLGSHIAELLGRKYELWQGCCPIHAALKAEAITSARLKHPNAQVLVHPECPKAVRDAADFALSTGGMCRMVKESERTEFIIGTEVGILHRLMKENPGKRFYPVDDNLICADMKKATLENVLEALKTGQHEVVVEKSVADRARKAISAMLELSK